MKPCCKVITSSPTITDLAQGKNGLIWIATYEGLYQYDGYQVIPAPYYNQKDEKLPSHWVRKVAIAQDGKIWMGTAASGLYVLNPKNRSYQHFSFKSDTQSSNPSINEIIPLDSEQAWIGSSNGVCKFHLQKGKLLSFNGRPQKEKAGTGKRQHLSATVVSALLLDGDTLWIGSTAGVDKLNLQDSSIEATPHKAPNDKLSQQTLNPKYLKVKMAVIGLAPLAKAPIAKLRLARLKNSRVMTGSKILFSCPMATFG